MALDFFVKAVEAFEFRYSEFKSFLSVVARGD